jgi:hypothetical protein
MLNQPGPSCKPAHFGVAQASSPAGSGSVSLPGGQGRNTDKIAFSLDGWMLLPDSAQKSFFSCIKCAAYSW